jgi:hypothetical protein
MVDTTKEVSGFPVNELGEVLTSRGIGTPTFVGTAPAGNFPVTPDGKSLLIVDANVERLGGWKFIQDGRYTSASPLTLTNGVKTKIGFNLTQLAYATGVGLTLNYDDVNDKFTPQVPGSTYIVSFRGRFLPAQNGGSVDLVVESPGFAYNPIVAQSGSFNKISENFVSVTEMIFIDPSIIANGLEIYITARGSNVNLYDYSIMVQRTFFP